MKTKVFLTSFALAAMFAGCSEDEFTTDNAGVVTDQSGMIELGENFMIGAAGVDDPATRTHWGFNDEGGLTNVYMPIAVATGGNNTIALESGTQSVLAPAIGLCWLGQTPGDQVYTNYEFFHNGWLGKGQEKAVFDPCDDAVLTNGWLYSDLRLNAAGTPNEEVATDATGFTAINYGKVSAADGKTALVLAEMNLNSGVYKTCNKAIFGGQYIAYYPYNADFINAGTIPAKSQVVFNTLTENDATNLEIAENTFRYSNVAEIDGGDMAKGFGFNNLSGIVRVILKNKTGQTATAGLTAKITKVMLYSPSSSFLKEVRLSASKIAAKATGTALYAKTVETSKTIVANLASDKYLGLAAANATNAEAIKNSSGVLYLTALPTTVKDLVVLAQNEDGKWAEATVGEITIPAGQGVNVVATMGDFKDVYYAVDKATLNAAITKIGKSATQQKPATIEVLGDIVLTANKEGTAEEIEIPSWTIVEGDKLIVSEDVTLRLKDNATAKCDIVIEGQACCTDSKAAGKLAVNGATIDGDLTVKAGGAEGKAAGNVIFGGATGVATVTANSVVTSDGQIDVVRNVDVFGDMTLNEAGKIVVGNSGDLNVKGGKLVNNGTIEVEGKFAILDAQGVTVPDAGENFNNNGKFIDNVGATIGGATQYMVFGEKGQYICKVNSQTRLDEAYVNKTACNVIQFIGSVKDGYDFTKADKHNDEYVDIVVDATGVEFAPSESVEIGNLSVNAGKDLTINTSAPIKNSKGDVVGYAAITVKGDIALNGKFETEEDVRNMVADNLTVLSGGTAKFGNRKESQDTTLKVLGTIENQKGGMFEITPKGTDTNVAYVTCTKLIEGGSFTGKPEVVR